MKRLANISLLILLWALIQPTLHAQYIEISGSDVDGKDTGLYTMDFGTVQYGQQSTPQTFTIKNTSQQTLLVDLKVYKTYADQGFYTSIDGTGLAPGQSTQVTIYFEPMHNMQYSTTLLLVEDAGRGTTAINLKGKGTYNLGPYTIRSLQNPKGTGQYYNDQLNRFGPKLAANEKALYDHLQATITSTASFSANWDTTRLNLYYYIDNLRLNQGQPRTDIPDAVQCIYTGAIRFLPGGYRNLDERRLKIACANGLNFRLADVHKIAAEHTFPAEQFSADGRGSTEKTPPFNDLHHLFPIYKSVNSSRSNLPFGLVTGTVTSRWYNDTPFKDNDGNDITSINGNGMLAGREEKVFEPSDHHKGVAARAMLYFMVAHGTQDGSAEASTPYANVQVNKEWYQKQDPLFRTWHKAFGVSSQEKKRNTLVQLFQQNRNPFVDFPPLAQRLPDLANPGAETPGSEASLSNINMGNLQVGAPHTFRFDYVNTGNVEQTYSYTKQTVTGVDLAINLPGAQERATTVNVLPLESAIYVGSITPQQITTQGQATLTFKDNKSNEQQVAISYTSFCPEVQGLRDGGTTSASATLNWANTPDAYGYTLTLSGPNAPFNTQETEQNGLEIQDLTPGSQYTVTVFTRCNENTNSPQGRSLTINTPLQDPEPPAQGTRVGLFPNPGVSSTTLILDSQEPQQAVSIQLINSQMVPIKSWQFNNTSPYQEYPLDLHNLAHGVYTLLIETPQSTQSKQLIIVSN